MKKMVLLFATILFTVFTTKAHTGHAHSRPLSELVLNIPAYGNYTVLINGVRHFGTNKFNIVGLQPGQHQISIIENIQRGRYGGTRTIHQGYVQIPRFSRVVARLNAYRGLDIIRVVNMLPPRNYHATCAYSPDRPQRYYDTNGHAHQRTPARKPVNRRR